MWHLKQPRSRGGFFSSSEKGAEGAQAAPGGARPAPGGAQTGLLEALHTKPRAQRDPQRGCAAGGRCWKPPPEPLPPHTQGSAGTHSVMRLASSVQAAVELAEKTR